MSQKRALIAAVLIGANASEHFTQDVEDMPNFGYADDVVESTYEVIDGGKSTPPKQQFASDQTRRVDTTPKEAPAQDKPPVMTFTDDEKKRIGDALKAANLHPYEVLSKLSPGKEFETFSDTGYSANEIVYRINVLANKLAPAQAAPEPEQSTDTAVPEHVFYPTHMTVKTAKNKKKQVWFSDGAVKASLMIYEMKDLCSVEGLKERAESLEEGVDYALADDFLFPKLSVAYVISEAGYKNVTAIVPFAGNG